MTRRGVGVLFAVAAVLGVAGCALTVVAWRDLSPADSYTNVGAGVAAVVYAALGMLIVRRVGNRIGWILLAEGLGSAVLSFASAYAVVGVATHPGTLPAPRLVGAMAEWAFVPVGLGLTLALVVFPTGRLPSRRWRPFVVAGAVAGAVALIGLVALPRTVALPAPGGVSLLYPNPLGIRSLHGMGFLGSVSQFGAVAVLVLVALAGAFVALVVRYRRGDRDLRQQIKWVAFAALAGLLLQVVAVTAQATCGCTESFLSVAAGIATGIIALLGVPAAITMAILRYRLYDIDVVVNKTLVYGAMAGFITVVYVAVVVGIGRGVGSDRNLGLSILATALVAVGFEPVRERVQRLANRLVYGRRATPYEVISEFSARAAQTVATEELLPRMAGIIGESTGAARVDVWLRLGSDLVREASWPEGGVPGDAAASVVGDRVVAHGADVVVPVRHAGELLGAISLTRGRGEQLGRPDTDVLESLAAQAGLVLRNVRLVEDLRTSRQRLMVAEDETRRRLERDLHDGAQQRLVSIALALRMAHGLVRDDAPRLSERIDAAASELSTALAELREFARGIHPAILTERGLEAGLSALAERAPVPVAIESSIGSRLPVSVEAAAYFVVAEALTNVAKYAGGATATVRAEIVDGALTVEVADDGPGGADPSRGSGLHGLMDRVGAAGGTLEVESLPGDGTRVIARFPVPRGEPTVAAGTGPSVAQPEAVG